jgi:hypothetical protein
MHPDCRRSGEEDSAHRLREDFAIVWGKAKLFTLRRLQCHRNSGRTHEIGNVADTSLAYLPGVGQYLSSQQQISFSVTYLGGKSPVHFDPLIPSAAGGVLVLAGSR